MKRYVLGKSVEADLNHIWEYIAQDSLEVADRWITRLFDSFRRLQKLRAKATRAKTSPTFQFYFGQSIPI